MMSETAISRIGSHIRALRLSRGLSLQELAENVNVSKGFLSRLENGRVVCSLPVLFNLSKAFSLPISEFFQGIDLKEQSDFLVIKEDQYRTIEKEEKQAGFQYSSILNRLIGPAPIEIVRLVLAPGVRRAPVQTDAYEYKYILRGQVNYHLNNKTVVLESGDSLFFDGRIPHYPYNAGADEVEMLVIYFYFSGTKEC